LFYPFNPLNLLESFITVTGQIIHKSGSSCVSSSRILGKTLAVPQKQINKAFGSKKRKYLKTTVNAIESKPKLEPESLIYYKSKSKSNPEPPLSRPSAKLK